MFKVIMEAVLNGKDASQFWNGIFQRKEGYLTLFQRFHLLPKDVISMQLARPGMSVLKAGEALCF